MERGKVQKFLASVFGREDDAAGLSRRDALAGLGLAGLFLATAKLLSSTPAEAKPLDKPAEAAAGSSPTPETKATDAQVAEDGAVDLNAADSADLTDLSAQRRWRRRRYWRRRYRRRYWRPRYWRRRYRIRRRRRYW